MPKLTNKLNKWILKHIDFITRTYHFQEPFEPDKHKRTKTERKVVVSSTDKRAMVSTGTGTEPSTKTKKIVTSSMYKQGHEPAFKTISLELESEENYKTETLVKIPKKTREITFTSSWGKPVRLEDLHQAGIVDDGTRNKLEVTKSYGLLYPMLYYTMLNLFY